VSVYSVAEALASTATPWSTCVQVPFNMLDQQMADLVFPRAAAAGRGVLVRSAFLRGVLTERIDEIPERLSALGAAARTALGVLGATKAELASYALRFVLSFNEVSSVIVGVRSVAELDANIEAAACGPWPMEAMARRAEFAVNDPIVSPTTWQGLI
jgi:aryl-alcohol dehydrogenase-like predicted oxidoreductase